jgi:hypothetical protein
VIENCVMATAKPKITIYLRNGYKAKLQQYAERLNERNPSVSNTSSEIIEDFIDRMIAEGELSPITDEDIQSEFGDKK